MKRLVLVAGLLVLFAATNALGFDGMRKGFVLGGGLGFAPSAGWSAEAGFDFPGFGAFSAKVDESKAGVAVNLIIGYAWDEKNMIVYEGNVAAYDSDVLHQVLSQGIDGPTWYHYYGDVGRSAFTAVGLGLYTFDGENFDQFDPGPGLLLGGGYEFARHFQIGLYIGAGSISEFGIDWKYHHISVILTGIAF